MNPTVSDAVVWRVIELADQDENPLGVEEPMKRQDAVDEAVRYALTGVDLPTAMRMSISLQRLLNARADPTCDIDMITAELLVHLGIDPLTVAWLSAACDGFHIHDEDGFDTIIDTDAVIRPHESAQQCSTNTTLSETVWWKAGGIMLVSDLPASALTNAVGRPLREVVSHPVLDRHDLRISDVDLQQGIFAAEIECQMPPMIATPDWLVAAMPRKEGP